MIQIENYLRLNLTDVILVLISTLLVVLFVKKFFWSYVIKYLNSRRDFINENIESATNKNLESVRILEEIKKEKEEAGEKANKLIEESRIIAEDKAEAIIKNAESEAVRIKQRAMNDVEIEKKEAMNSIKEEIGNIAILVAEKIIDKEIDQDVKNKYVDDFINNVGDSKWQA